MSDEQVHWDLGESQSYGQYLGLDEILSAQQPVSFEHDEMLFIIIHQASELWMKLCLHELTAALDHIRRDDLGPSFKMLSRVSRIQAQLTQSWDVLATLTPAEYSAFRNQLGRASGFQSYQYRMLEFVIGNKNADMIEVHKRDPDVYAALERALHSPSIYDESLRLLSRRGFEIPEEYLDRDWSQPYQPNKQVAAAWLAVYHSIDDPLGSVRAGREARRPRPEIPALALQSHEDGRAHHRLQTRHRRHGWCVLSRQGARAALLPGAVVDSHVDVTRVATAKTAT